MPKVLRKKSLASFAAIIDVDVPKRLTDAEATKTMRWLQQHLEMPDQSYDVAPVKLVWKDRVAERRLPVRVRVVEYFN